jgi:hypothetical protein
MSGCHHWYKNEASFSNPSDKAVGRLFGFLRGTFIACSYLDSDDRKDYDFPTYFSTYQARSHDDRSRTPFILHPLTHSIITQRDLDGFVASIYDFIDGRTPAGELESVVKATFGPDVQMVARTIIKRVFNERDSWKDMGGTVGDLEDALYMMQGILIAFDEYNKVPNIRTDVAFYMEFGKDDATRESFKKNLNILFTKLAKSSRIMTGYMSCYKEPSMYEKLRRCIFQVLLYTR